MIANKEVRFLTFFNQQRSGIEAAATVVTLSFVEFKTRNVGTVQDLFDGRNGKDEHRCFKMLKIVEK